MVDLANRDLWPSYPGEHKLDERDRGIIAERMATLDAIEGPRVGDWVDFADGTKRRISHIWQGEPGSVQTSRGGSFYLANGGVSMSGSLFTGVPPTSLTLTEEIRQGGIWIFHHDWACAHNGVDMPVPFRVFSCNLPAPTC